MTNFSNHGLGDLATMPASRDELEELCSVLWERCSAAEHERDSLRAWAEKMPTAETIRVSRNVLTWMQRCPAFPTLAAPQNGLSDESDRG